MALEEGIIIKQGTKGQHQTAWVKIVRSGACESCSSRDSCKVNGGQGEEVEVANDINARIGDRIQIMMATGSLLKATFLLYLFPILCMILGGLIGHWISQKMMISGSVLSVIVSAAALVLSMIIIRIKGRRMGEQKAYQPRILRVIGREPAIPQNLDNSMAAE